LEKRERKRTDLLRFRNSSFSISCESGVIFLKNSKPIKLKNGHERTLKNLGIDWL